MLLVVCHRQEFSWAIAFGQNPWWFFTWPKISLVLSSRSLHMKFMQINRTTKNFVKSMCVKLSNIKTSTKKIVIFASKIKKMWIIAFRRNTWVLTLGKECMYFFSRPNISLRDGNFTHGSGYPWIPDPMGMGLGVTFYLWARPPGTQRRHGQ